MTSVSQQLILVALMALGTALTRFLPFVLFPQGKSVPKVVKYLGNVLPCAVMALLVVYCLKDMSFTAVAGFVPHIISVCAVVGLHVWKRNSLLSIGGGTLLYMLLVQFIFV